MKSIEAGPHGVHNIGDRRTLPKHEAAVLVNSGHAEYLGGIVPETATVAPEEAPTAKPPEVRKGKK